LSRRIMFVVALIFLLPNAGIGKSRPLEFMKAIGDHADSSGWMSFVSFSPDGTMIAANGRATQGLAVWSFPGGRLLPRLPTEAEFISPHWKYYAGFHGIADTESGKVVLSSANNVWDYAFSPDDRYVAEATHRKNGQASIRVIELASGRELRSFGILGPMSMAISPDGHTLAAGYWNNVTLWNMLTGKRLAVLRGFGRYVDGISFSRDGRLLAAGTDAGGLQVWRVRPRHKAWSLHIDGLQVSVPAFSPDGTLLAVGVYGTGTAWLIDARSGRILDHQKVSDLGCGSVAFSPNGRFLITPSTGGLIKWPYDHGGTVRVFQVNVH
jgi:WD40 repeat protein